MKHTLIAIACLLCSKPTCNCKECIEMKGDGICVDCSRTVDREHISCMPSSEKEKLNYSTRTPVPLSRSKENAPS